MKSLPELLSEQPVFAGLSESDLVFLAGCCGLHHVPHGDVVFREGGPADRAFVVRSGRVVLELHEPGRGSFSVGTVEPGEVLGWSWLHAPYRWRTDALAVGDSSLFAFDAACLRQKLEADPRLGYAVVLRMAELATERLHATRVQLIDLYGPRSGDREDRR